MDRRKLAEALAGATVEMLREWAGDAAADAEEFEGRQLERSYLGLAALALAIADVDENGRDITFGNLGRRRQVEIDGDGVDCAGQGESLPQALAHLLTGAAP